ncbi:MAG TPA: MmgE/PrpD family protein [Ramlibacter sp.]|nr:MmgE/PrpD family protein [Ramlibacter sp.]
MSTISERIAAFTYRLRYEELPPVVLEKAKLLVLDTLGVCIAARELDFAQAAVGLATRWAGPAEASILGNSAKVPAQSAALVNGVMAHGQDFDDTHTESLVHPSGVMVPTLLAACERDGTSGAQALCALAGATEAMIRLALPAQHRFSHRGFQTTMVTGSFGAALISARTAGFDLEQTVHALGIAGSFTSGLMECVPAGASTKQVHPGWAARSGLAAADFAAAGFTGPLTVFEGPLGLYSAFLHGQKELDLDSLFEGLGERWHLLDIRPKLYPCGHPLNTFIDCAAVLRRELGNHTHRIASVLCEPAPGAVSMMCEPWDRKTAPATGYDARFSLPFGVAVMLLHGQVGMAEFNDTLANDPQVRALMARMQYRVNPAFRHKDMPARITLTLDDGTALSHTVASGRGDAAHPVMPAELLAKYRENTRGIAARTADEVAQRVLALEKESSLDALMAMAREL